jgi:hypothetical protein
MKLNLSVLLLSVSLASAVQVWALPDSCGEANVSFKVTTQTNPSPLASPEAGVSQVVFLETEETDGQVLSGVEANLGIDGSWIGATKGNSYLVVAVSPGQHHVCANWQANFAYEWQRTSVASLNVEPGKVYYFRVNIVHIRTNEIDYHSLDLTPVNEDEGKYLLGSLPLATSKPKK